MPVIVCRSTSTWGPPMRFWRRSEIVRVKLPPDQPADFEAVSRCTLGSMLDGLCRAAGLPSIR